MVRDFSWGDASDLILGIKQALRLLNSYLRHKVASVASKASDW